MKTSERVIDFLRREFVRHEDHDDWPDEVNVHRTERAASLVAGAGLCVVGLLRSSLPGLLLVGAGALLVRRGMTGHSYLYRTLRVSSAHGLRGPSASVPHGQGVRLRRSITVRRPPAEVYAFWRRLETLPPLLSHVESVEILSERLSRWRACGPAESALEWEAEIINDLPGELIAWRSVRGSNLHHAGSIRFDRAAGGHGTRVTVTLEYQPPAGLVGAVAARLLGVDPELQVEEALHRLKGALEDGIVPGPHADERGTLAGVRDLEDARAVLREESQELS